MKFEQIEPILQKEWQPCQDFKPWTWKEKLDFFYHLNMFLIFFSFYGSLFGLRMFKNCKHIEKCKNAVYKLNGDCKAGEWK